jgi:hypothetical protein
LPFSPLIRHLGFCALATSAVLLAGCNIIGAVAGKAPKPDILAAYKGLAGQSVGIMVYVDPDAAMNWPTLQLDMGNYLQHKLKDAQTDESLEDLKGTTFPYEPRSFVRYQRENPGLEALPITDVAPKLGVDRLIYLQVNEFTTRAEGTITMYLGRINVTMQVIEVDPATRTAAIAYSDPNLKIKFPRKAPDEGMLSGNDRVIYQGTVDEITTELAVKFFRHPDYSMGVVDPDAN